MSQQALNSFQCPPQAACQRIHWRAAGRGGACGASAPTPARRLPRQCYRGWQGRRLGRAAPGRACRTGRRLHGRNGTAIGCFGMPPSLACGPVAPDERLHLSRACHQRPADDKAIRLATLYKPCLTQQAGHAAAHARPQPLEDGLRSGRGWAAPTLGCTRPSRASHPYGSM